MKIMHECICFILHTFAHTHTHSLTFTFAAFMLPFTLLCPNKKLPSTRPKRKTQKIEREKRYSVAFLRLHSRDDGSVKWLLATRRRQATLILRVLFVNVAASPHALSLSLALHRICRYCYQLSKAPHTHTHGNRLPHCITYAAPALPRTRHLYVLTAPPGAGVGVGVCRRVAKTFYVSFRIARPSNVCKCACLRVCVCVCFCISSLFTHSAPFSYALHLGSFVLFWYSCVCGVK